MSCPFCGGEVTQSMVRFGFFVSQCSNCEQEKSGFMSIADMIAQAESVLEDR